MLEDQIPTINGWQSTISDGQKRNYYITVHNHGCQENLYSELVNESGNEVIPERCVEIVHLLANSKNTLVSLTKQEADNLRNDPRIKSVALADLSPFEKESLFSEITAEFVRGQELPIYSQFAPYTRFKQGQEERNYGLLRCSTSLTSEQLNWGLTTEDNWLRLDLINPSTPRGSSAPGANIIVEDPTPAGLSNSITSTINLKSLGRNVDIVLMDTPFDEGSPEFAENPDGTGGTRFVSYNWFQHNPVVLGSAVTNYIYAQATGSNHGHNCASVAAGNTQGFAQKANIYSMSTFPSDGLDGSSISGTGYVKYINAINYVREFHRNKAINPDTGIKNPTIVSMSLGFTMDLGAAGYRGSEITSIFYNGSIITAPVEGFTDTELREYGIPISHSTAGYLAPISWGFTDFTAVKEAYDEAADEGIIIIEAGGNHDQAIYSESDTEWNNYYELQGSRIYYSRPSGIQYSDDIIMVGGTSTVYNDRKAIYSVKGPKIDIYAPAYGFKSQTHYNTSPINDDLQSVLDVRDTNYSFETFNGTSNACPVVAGIVACYLEIYPWMGVTEIKEILAFYANKDHIAESIDSYTGIGSPVSDWKYTNYGLWGSPNHLVRYVNIKPDSGLQHPRQKYNLRPTTGKTYPRNKVRIKG